MGILMYEILKQINDTTSLAVNDNVVYILKKIHANDAPLYKALMGVTNPNIAKFYGFTTIDESLFVVEQYVQGITLKQFVDNNADISDDAITSITLGICNGLNEIHSLGIVHRDITPTNIMIDPYGNAVIIDFGISRFTKSNQSTDTQILGTHGFAAPEQYGFSQTGTKADIYSLGVLINYMATKCMPNEVLASGRLGQIVKRCIEVDESNRYADAVQLKNALEKRGFSYFFHLIPGFRQGKTSHILIALAYYLCVIFLLVISLAISINALDAFCLVMCILSVFIYPVMILLDFCDWPKRLNLTRNIEKGELIAIKVVLLVICIILTMVFILIAPRQ